MKNVILDEGELGRGIMQKMSQNQKDRLSHLGLHLQRSFVAPRRTTFINQARFALNQNIEESDTLSLELENKYMKIIENFVTGAVKTVGVEETNALIAIRKEYMRKNLTIDAIFKDHEKLDKLAVQLHQQYELLQKEYEKETELRHSLANEVHQLRNKFAQV